MLDDIVGEERVDGGGGFGGDAGSCCLQLERWRPNELEACSQLVARSLPLFV